MARKLAELRPPSRKPVLTLRLRLAVRNLPAGATVDITDVLFQAGSTATGWVPNVTELPWTAGVVAP
jgi:hypothetical protein